MQAYPLEDDLGSEEAQQAALELSDMAAAVETSVAEAMERGRSRRGPDEASWDHSHLDVEQLSAALKDLSNFPVPRPSSAAVLARGRVIVALRTALKAEEWGDVAALLQGVQLEATWDEVQSAAKELEHASVAVIEEVKAALKTGRSLKEYGKATMTNFNATKSVTPVLWNRSGLSTERLTAAVRRAKTFPADGLPEEVTV